MNEQRVAALEEGHAKTRADIAEIRSDLRAFGGVLVEIKQAINAGRPNVWVIVPIALTFILMIVGGVAAFGGIRESGAARQANIEQLRHDVDRIEARQWELKR